MSSMDEWTDRLSDYLDDELPADVRAALERHLADCAECTRTLAELAAVREQARALVFQTTPPARDLWPGIAARIGADAAAPAAAEGAEDDHARAGFWRRRISLSMPQLAAAATVVVLASAVAVGVLLRTAPGAPAGSVARGAAPAVSPAPGSMANGAAAPGASASGARLAASAVPAASATPELDRAVTDLEHALAAQKGRLDPATMRVLHKNLAVIDSAIAQIRKALAADPGDFYLNRSLAETMQRKLDVLRLATKLASTAS